MTRIHQVRLAYAGLLALSLPIPWLHDHFTDRVIETMRPILQTPDGHRIAMLMPVDILFLRWLGQGAFLGPPLCLALIIMTFARETAGQWASRIRTVFGISILQSGFTLLYAIYATWLLGSQWMYLVERHHSQTASKATVRSL